MPNYDFECNTCHRTLEKFQTFREMERTPTLDCRCGGTMIRLIGAPALVTDTRFFAKQGDGFGEDQQSRRIAHTRARAAGVNTTGATYFPQLCRRGKPFDPFAWCHSRSEIVRKLQTLGRGAEGSINVKPRPSETDAEPYSGTVAEDVVNRAVRERIHKEKLKLTPSEKRRLKEDVRIECTPMV